MKNKESLGMADEQETLVLIEQIGKSIECNGATTDFRMVKPEGQESMHELMARLDLNEQEVVFFCSLFMSVATKKHNNSDKGLAELMKISTFEFLKNYKVIQALKDKRLIDAEESCHGGRENYEIKKSVFRAILLDDEKFFESIREVDYSFLNFMQSIRLLMNNNSRYEKQEFDQLHERLNAVVEQGACLPEVKWLHKYNLEPTDIAIVCYLCISAIRGTDSLAISNVLDRLMYSITDIYEYKRGFMQGTGKLVKNKIIELRPASFIEGATIGLTEAAHRALLYSIDLDDTKKAEYRALHLTHIKSGDVVRKPLYFERTLRKDLNGLTRILGRNRFLHYKRNMEEKKLTAGVTSLFYGFPGTGKTEFVRQLAHSTRRDILMVNMSSVRDKFVGESEKQVHKIFKEYRRAVGAMEREPILLFNECDALLGRRMAVTDSVDQMNNSMQNILLQEMEDFEGILIATSNVTAGLDKAFERRFLLKIKFERPSRQIQSKMLRAKLKSLSEHQLAFINERYELTGGQIDNLVKRFEMMLMLGNGLDEESIIRVCEQELNMNGNSRKRVGY